jgi:FkbM family methyltransferase
MGFTPVLAFEPAPINYNRLLRNVAATSWGNARVEVICSAVGSSQGNIRFALNRQSPSTCKIADASDVAAGEEIVEVPIITLDAVCAQRGIDFIGFLKVDVEGYELSVLQGADSMLRRRAIRFIFMEVIDLAWHNAGYTAADIYDFLYERGYVPVRTTADSLGAEISRDEFILGKRNRNVLWHVPRQVFPSAPHD